MGENQRTATGPDTKNPESFCEHYNESSDFKKGERLSATQKY